VKRSSVLALVLVGVTVLCVVGACLGMAAVGPGALLGCDTDPTPAVPGVQDDPRRVAELFPRLGPVTAAHWQIRDARPRICPDPAPMTYVYDGLVTLAADPAGYPFTPAAAPAFPAGLAGLAPAHAAWQVSPAYDAAMGGNLWLDPASRTVYFHTRRS
jgi:hypothetical protein